MTKRKKLLIAATMALTVGAGSVAALRTALADAPTDINIAIPNNVTVSIGSTQVFFIGKPTATSPVTCAPGTPFPQTVVAVDPAGGSASQITGVLAFHDHEIALGSRYTITGGGTTCSADLKLYQARLN